MQAKLKHPERIRAILLDPFKGIAAKLYFKRNDWPGLRELLDCQYSSPVRLDGRHAVWIDAEGADRKPFIYPCFKLTGAKFNVDITQRELAGYGLITGFNPHDEMLDCHLDITDLAGISFEPWTQRINPDLVIEQLLRIYLNHA